MRNDELKRVQNFYDSRFKEHGDCINSVGWSDVESQRLRFEVLTRGIELESASILDLGCGLGDLVGFLGEKSDSFKYMGLDVSGELIKAARQKYGHLSHVQFQHSDIFDFDPKLHKFDFGILSGTLTFKIEDNWAHTQAVLRRIYEASEQGFCANFLTSYVDYEEEKNFHYQPEKIFSFCKTLSKKVNLFHDYPLYEFTIQVFK